MKTIQSWNDLSVHGVIPLTGEACGLSYRLLCDLTAAGAKIVAKMFGVPELKFAEPWNSGSSDVPHVGSIMLSPEMLTPLAVFVLLEGQCQEVWLIRSGGALGFEATDSADEIGRIKQRRKDDLLRRFSYAGTAGDRNVHVMSGRVS